MVEIKRYKSLFETCNLDLETVSQKYDCVVRTLKEMRPLLEKFEKEAEVSKGKEAVAS